MRAVSQVIDDAKRYDHGILLEYQLPMTSRRLDCMVTGPPGTWIEPTGGRDTTMAGEMTVALVDSADGVCGIDPMGIVP